jgi:hypothetical protein
VLSHVLHMIKRRAEAADKPYSTCCHTFRATEITTYLRERRPARACPDYSQSRSPRTTKLYDRTREELTFEEVETKI